MKYSLVVPCYNESRNIPCLIDNCIKVLKKRKIEIILVDNGSTDNSSKILSNLSKKNKSIKIIKIKKNKGYGYGILKGLRCSTGDIIGWTHADLQTDLSDYLRAIKFFKNRKDKVFVKGKRLNRSFKDNFFTFGMSLLATILLNKTYWDINAQPTVFTKKFFNKWTKPPNDFSLDLYSYYFSNKENLTKYRINVNFKKRIHGFSSWNFNLNSKIKLICNTIKYMILIRKENRHGNYNS